MMRKFFFLCFVCLSTVTALKAQWLWDSKDLAKVKANLHTPAYTAAYQALLAQADAALAKTSYSVTQKQSLAPSGDVHDYVSLSRYWWPNPDTQDGLPYINKDGLSNPELNNYDRNRLGNMATAVNTLALAYYFSENETYAEKAALLLKTWFINADTKMNPNLEYAQFIPGMNGSKGRPEGLIDTYSFVHMLNSISFLKSSVYYDNALDAGLKTWFTQLTKWIKASDQGKKEDAAKNNHATALDAQLLTYYLFSEQHNLAVDILQNFLPRRVYTQIEPDGKQPHELWRTLAYHYSQYNLSHMLDVLQVADKIGLRLYAETSADGRNVFKGLDFLALYLGKDVTSWPYKQIKDWDAKQQDVAFDLYRANRLDPTKTRYLDLFNRYSSMDAKDRRRLLYAIPCVAKE